MALKTLKESIAWGQGTIGNISHLENLAKTKADGVYKSRGIGYLVKDNRVTHYHCNEGPSRNLYLNSGHFAVKLGSFERESDAHAQLKVLAKGS